MIILTITKLYFLIINIVIIYLFALIYNKYGNEKHFHFLNKQTEMSMTDSIYFSINVYSTIGNADIYAKSKFMKKVVIIQIFFLICMILLLGCSNIESK